METKKIEEVTVIRSHEDYIYCILLLSDGRLASCSEDGYIKIFNLFNYEFDLVIETQHSAGIYSLCEIKNNKLVSSSDPEIKIFSINKKNYECETTLIEHERSIYKLINLDNNRFASCSNDSTIKIFISEFPYECIKTLEGHNSWVISIIKIKNREVLVSASNDNSLGFWNLSTYRNIKMVNDVICRDSSSLIEYDNKIFVGGFGTILVIDVNGKNIIKKIESDNLFMVTAFYVTSDNHLLIGVNEEIDDDLSFSHFIELNKDNYGFKRIKENVDYGTIYKMVGINDKFFASSSDNSIKIWKF